MTTAAVLLVGSSRNTNSRNSRTWLTPTGQLTALVDAGQPDIAAQAAWLLFDLLSGQSPTNAARVAELARTLHLVQPRLVHVRARQTEVSGDRERALADIDAAVALRAGSTDRGWIDLLSYRDALAARHVAASRPAAPARPRRVGHSAPENRPERRRFQLSQAVADARPVVPTAPGQKARARKARASRAARSG